MTTAHTNTSAVSLRRGYLAAITTVCIWSGFILVSRAGGISPLTAWDTMALRYGSAALLLLPYWLWRRPVALMDRRIWVLAAFGGLGYGLLTYSAFKLSPAAHGAILLPGLLPFGAALFSWLLLGEQPAPARIGALTLTAAGVAALGSDVLGHGGTLLGDCLMAGASLCWSAYAVLCRRWHIPPVAALCGVALLTALAYLPIYLLWLPSRLDQASTGLLLFQAAYHGPVATIFAMWLYLRAQASLGPSRMGSLMALVPALSGLAAVPLLGEPLTAPLMAGLTLVSAGAWLGAHPEWLTFWRKPCRT